MVERDPRFVFITSTREQARGLLEALAGEDPPGFADELGGSVRELYASRTRDVLQYFGIYLPEEAVPPDVVTPSEEDARRILREIDEAEEVEPYVGFRPPWCGGDPPPHSITFGYIFEVVAERAAGQPRSAS